MNLKRLREETNNTFALKKSRHFFFINLIFHMYLINYDLNFIKYKKIINERLSQKVAPLNST